MVKVTITKKDGSSVQIENDKPETVAEMAKKLGLDVGKIAVNGMKAKADDAVPDGAVVAERQTAKGI